MPDLTLTAFPGKDLKEFLDNLEAQGKKFPIAESLIFLTDMDGNPTTSDSKAAGGWEIKEDIVIKAGSRVHLELWNGKTKEKQTRVVTFKIRPFTQAYDDKKAREQSKGNSTDAIAFE